MLIPSFRAHPVGLAGIECCVLVPESIREWARCHVLRPLLRVLRGGVTPRRLAWSLALGMVVGINPSVGLTSLLVIFLAWVFGLSKIASLIGTHVVNTATSAVIYSVYRDRSLSVSHEQVADEP